MLPNSISGHRLSPQQTRLWLLMQESCVYRAQCAILLDGRIDTERLQEAVRSVMQRHDILRTSFERPPGLKVPLQVVADDGKPCWKTIDLKGLNFRKQEAGIEDQFLQQGRSRCDFEHGPLLRLSLIVLSDSQHVLMICLPSLCADSATLNLFTCELSAAYGLQNPRQDEELQYANYADWQYELTASKDEEAQEAASYWHRQSTLARPALRMPFADYAVQKTYDVNAVSHRFDPTVSFQLSEFGQTHDVTVGAILLACWQTLLWRVTGEPRQVVDVVFDGRNFAELQGGLGLFARPLPISCHLQGNAQFMATVRQVHALLREASDWQDYFGEGTQTRETNHEAMHGLRGAGFEFEVRPAPRRAADVTFSIIKQYSCINRFQIKLCCFQTDDTLLAMFYYLTFWR